MAVYYAVICFYADWMMELLPFLDWTVEALTDTVMTVTVRSPAPPSSLLWQSLFITVEMTSWH